MLTAGAIMTTDLVTVRPDASIEEAIELLLNEQISGLPVTDDDGRLVGVITEFALLAVAYDQRVKNHTVSQHMTRELITVDVERSDQPRGRLVHRAPRSPRAGDEGRPAGRRHRPPRRAAGTGRKPSAACTA